MNTRAEKSQLTDPESGQKIAAINQQLLQVDLKLDYLENQSRRNNLRFDGITEDTKEDWAATECKIVKIIT